ncbi:LEA14-like dessication related protein [Chitinophaga skermanii]|uniref:LEA14-like dessication related protein n=2 Tax=Chitinophaga skermanii TaxID=331697 RepID=A0A327QCF7_9BACT|nr:LEA14-like dessication related protein [Chitinophaga skermanii]
MLLVAVAWCGISACGNIKDLQFVRIADVALGEMGFSKTTVKMNIAYFNPNNFALKLKDAQFDVYIDDSKVGHSMQDTLILIPAKDTFYFPVKIDVNMGNLMKNAANILANKEVTLKAMGNCKVGKSGVFFPFPIKVESKQQFNLF